MEVGPGFLRRALNGSLGVGMDTRNLTPKQLLRGVHDWRSYIEALRKCDDWWRDRQPWSVLGNRDSWQETVKVLHDVIKWRDWDTLGDSDRRRLLGRPPGENWALLGRMRPSARYTVFDTAARERIQGIVHGVVSAADDAFPPRAFEAYEALWHIHGVGEGIATRLLTLARPDRFVSLNKASRVGLADFFGFAPSTLGRPQNYRRLLTKIYNQEWYRAPAPRDEHERIISWMRTALLDSFVYAAQDSV